MPNSKNMELIKYLNLQLILMGKYLFDVIIGMHFTIL